VFEWLAENRSWIFSGVGLSVIGWCGQFLWRSRQRSKVRVRIESGEASQNSSTIGRRADVSAEVVSGGRSINNITVD
jgi:predicted negative regulator of RcsB-dependent stress response